MKQSGYGGMIQGQRCGEEERKQRGGRGPVLPAAGYDESSVLFQAQSETSDTACVGGDGDESLGWCRVDSDDGLGHLGKGCRSAFEEQGGGNEGDKGPEQEDCEMGCSWCSNSSKRWRRWWW